ncbi:MAG: hypothetical protein JST21_03960 [Bacteroidetes bacterium]|nr:hypothetical protein [Bacteroidota bacterium]
MKHLLLAATVLISISAFSQSDKYESAMKQALQQYDSAKSMADLESIAAKFQRIGDAEKTQWLPYYWSGLALTRTGWMYFPNDKGVTAVKTDNLSSTIDALSGRINALEDKADALATDDDAKSEILLIRNMAYTQQMIIDPQTRYMTYGMQAGTALDKAMDLNPNNPRAYYLKGSSLFGTPEQFGGGKAAAKPMFEKAVELGKAEQQKPLMPHWGLELSEQMLAACQ